MADLHPTELTRDPITQKAWDAAAAVPDPEVPCINVAELGILREIEMVDGKAVAYVTPTYTGCPATLAIELAIEVALRDAGYDPKIERVISPPWTTNWISDEGRKKLHAYGIAPPVNGSNSKLALFGATSVNCPQCGSEDTERLSEFGSTACKAQYRCKSCLEPFDYFKCI